MFSFAIVMQEVIVRGEPYCMLSLSPEGERRLPLPLPLPNHSDGRLGADARVLQSWWRS